MAIGYLGLGSNVGDRRANLQAAADALGAHGVRVLASSATYDTDPVGEILDQPSFLNACLRIDTDLDPEALLDACKAVERELGRPAEYARHSPRPIDVDVLLLGDLELPLAAADAAPRAGARPALRPRPAARARLRAAHPGRRVARRGAGGAAGRRGRAARGRSAARQPELTGSRRARSSSTRASLTFVTSSAALSSCTCSPTSGMRPSCSIT